MVGLSGEVFLNAPRIWAKGGIDMLPRFYKFRWCRIRQHGDFYTVPSLLLLQLPAIPCMREYALQFLSRMKDSLTPHFTNSETDRLQRCVRRNVWEAFFRFKFYPCEKKDRISSSGRTNIRCEFSSKMSFLSVAAHLESLSSHFPIELFIRVKVQESFLVLDPIL